VHAGAADRRRVLVLAVALAPVLGAWNNLVVHRLPGRPGSYVVANVAAAGVLLTAARASGLSWAELGLGRRRLAAGARCGGTCAAVVAAGYGTALAVPALRLLLGDARASGLGGGELAGQVLVRIPLGTVLWEEVAFRGVLLATLGRLLSRRGATGVSAALFGLCTSGPRSGRWRPTTWRVDRWRAPAPWCWPAWAPRPPASSSPSCACAAAACSPPPCCTWPRTAWACSPRPPCTGEGPRPPHVSEEDPVLLTARRLAASLWTGPARDGAGASVRGRPYTRAR
jgi:uncharacterized protein